MTAGSRRHKDLRGQIGRPAVRAHAHDEEVAAFRRALSALFVLLSPVVGVVALLAIATAGRSSRVRRRAGAIALVGVAAVAAAVASGASRAYATPYRELVGVLRGALPTRNQTGSPSVREVFADRWGDWLELQLPFAVALAVMITGLVLLRQRRYDAHWRAPTRTVATDRQIARTMRRLTTQRTSPGEPGERVSDKPADPADNPPGTAPRRPQRRTPRRASDTVASVDDLTLQLGVNLDTGRAYEISAAALGMHSVITGPTGFGKTTTVTRLTYELLASPPAAPLRLPHLFIDMKGDPDQVAFLKAVAAATGRDFHLVTVDPATSATYNPLRHGSAGELKTRLIECEANAADGGFSEPHHRRVAERYLLLACEVLDGLIRSETTFMDGSTRRPWRRDLGDLVRLLDPAHLARQRPAELAQRIENYLNELAEDKDLRKSITGVRQRFALMHEEVGPILEETGGGLDLYDAIQAGDIVLFSLDAMRNASVARHLGNLALQDLTSVFARLQNEGYRKKQGKVVWTVVDEFSALGGSLLLNLFSRARGAGGALALASQDFADFRAVSEAFEASVSTNANIGIFHRQKGQAASDRSEEVGTYQTWEETVQVQEDRTVLGSTTAAGGVGSLRMVDKFHVHPNDFKNLRQGQAIVIVAHPESTVTRVAIAPPPDINSHSPTTQADTHTSDTPDLQTPESVSPAYDANSGSTSMAAAPLDDTDDTDDTDDEGWLTDHVPVDDAED